MGISDLLTALAEISIAIAGLAGIVLSLATQRDADESEPGMRAWRVEILVATSAAGFSFSIAPFFLTAFERGGPADWVALSVVSSVAASAYGVYGLRTQRKRFGSIVPHGHHSSDISFILVTFGSGAIVLSNAAGLVALPHHAAYLCAIAPWFFTALLVFFRAVFDLTRAPGSESQRDA